MKYFILFLLTTCLGLSQNISTSNGIIFQDSEEAVITNLARHGVFTDKVNKWAWSNGYYGEGTRFDKVKNQLYVVKYEVNFTQVSVDIHLVYYTDKVFTVVTNPSILNVVSPATIEKEH